MSQNDKELYKQLFEGTLKNEIILEQMTANLYSQVELLRISCSFIFCHFLISFGPFWNENEILSSSTPLYIYIYFDTYIYTHTFDILYIHIGRNRIILLMYIYFIVDLYNFKYPFLLP